MGSPLSHIISNLFMEDFEAKALNTSPLNQNYGKDLLMTFLSYGLMEEKHWKFISNTSIVCLHPLNSPWKLSQQ